MTGADQLADWYWSSGWQVMIKCLTGADQEADSRWSNGCKAQIAWRSRRCSWGSVGTDQEAEAMIAQLSKWSSRGWLCADQEADTRLSSCWQVLIKRLTGICQAADKHWSGGCVGTDCRAQKAQINWLKDAIRVAESVIFNRLRGKWSSADEAADRRLTSGWQLLINWLTGAN